ncbi:hypothetical protein LYZ89_16425 [Xanthomonas hortorum pv. vitians]|uniref:hypothetical protein n=1 Tax=Xanthomonas hortorum TaxID=56454 RepID=UPI0012FD428B|nr:hypothetical protein [Xanthomonas hortorum]MCE4338620.1 hypothetical protein [Xanthomonas hortorum pv. vitians]MCE4506514.1 hypothetical protein [Xanthomonas hortorum pv. vitians]WJM74978.1 hypothetical protein QTJ10_14305 [Xanthomonas hortorum pv. vitians]
MPAIRSESPQWPLETPTPAEVEEMRQLGLQPGAVGYDESGNLVRRQPDGTLEVLVTAEP